MDPIRSEAQRTSALEVAFRGIFHGKPALDYLVRLIPRGLFHTLRQAGPEILMIAIAARPGAVDKAKMVGSA